MNIKPLSLKIFSVNVGRCSATHQIALETAFENCIDILLIQEPYISKDIARKLTCKNPSYQCFTLIDDCSIRPRVLAYANKNNGLSFVQDAPVTDLEVGKGDLLLTIKFPGNVDVKVINVYNAPPGAIDPGAEPSFLYSLAETNFLPKTILAGDFNLHHPSWNPSYQSSPSTQAEDLVSWIESRN
ncbi:hypothetical protein K3495_g9766 [Podosphaera aphanis]|nr:hypothetical protein K3495_g9766 [Podosphaera aphanis]